MNEDGFPIEHRDFFKFHVSFQGCNSVQSFLESNDASTLKFSGLMEICFKFQGQKKPKKHGGFPCWFVFAKEIEKQKPQKNNTSMMSFVFCWKKSSVRFKLWWKTFWNLILFLFQGKVWWMPPPDPGGSIRGRMDVVKLNILTLPEIIGLFLVPPKRWYYSILITQLAFFQWYI